MSDPLNSDRAELDAIYYRASACGQGFTSQSGEIDTDICIIGGGFAGLGCAASLMERGHSKVVVLESERVGHGASGRNGGFVFGGFSLGNKELIKQLGLQQAQSMYARTLSAIELIRGRIDRYQIDCEKSESGVLLANWFDDDKSLVELQKWMRDDFAVDWEFIDRSQLSEMLCSKRYFGALHERQAFHFHPLKYAQGLAATMQANGIRVFEHSRATAIHKTSSGFAVDTCSGVVRCREVVICCGGYLEGLLPQLQRAAMPIATYVMVTEPIPELLDQTIRTEAAVYDTRFAFDYYRRLGDQRLLWGGRISIRDRQPDEVVQLLRKDLAKVYPALESVKVDFAWSGMMSYARHQMPLLGRSDEGIWYGIGFGGHGVAPTSMGGEILADAILGKAAIPSAFSRYKPEPTFGVLGRIAAQLTYWTLQTKDWLRQ